jgi:hypothetical protein
MLHGLLPSCGVVEEPTGFRFVWGARDLSMHACRAKQEVPFGEKGKLWIFPYLDLPPVCDGWHIFLQSDRPAQRSNRLQTLPTLLTLLTLKTVALENRNFSPRPLHKITLSRRTIEIERKKLQTHEKHHSNRARIPQRPDRASPAQKRFLRCKTVRPLN